MKYHWSTKLTAFVLVAVSAFFLVIGGLSVLLNLNNGLYFATLEERLEAVRKSAVSNYCYNAARYAAAEYQLEQVGEEGTPEYEIWAAHFHSGSFYDYDRFAVDYRICSETGTLLKERKSLEGGYEVEESEMLEVPAGRVVCLGSNRKSFPSYEELTDGYEWVSHYGEELPGLDSRTMYYELVDWDDMNVYRIERFADERYRVEVLLSAEAVDGLADAYYGSSLKLMRWSYAFRWYDVAVAAVSAVVLLASLIWLGFAAGKKPDSHEIRPRGTNRLPLDLFAGLAGTAGMLLLGLITELFYYIDIDSINDILWFKLTVAAVGVCAALIALLCAMLLTALCAQVRLGGVAWLRRTVTGRVLGVLLRWVKAVWRWLYDRIFRRLAALCAMLPAMWQWLVPVCVYMLVLPVVLVLSLGSGFFVLVYLALCAVGIAAVIFGAHSFGVLQRTAEKMAQGDLDVKADTRFMGPTMSRFGRNLNDLGAVCIRSAREQMKAERMRTELITNVSHDIKTPLTSIINYVDLLKTAENQEQRETYLEVLDRQSLRLKKLIDDLMEMSKASSGSIIAELEPTDVAEAVDQALGEFADRLELAQLNVIFRRPETEVIASCDGKLLWRVLANLLSNVVKYGQPGTRVYVDLSRTERKVKLAVKNISREELNISADELMERFVRGDASRNSDGNGLGLNIAASLMEVQGGSLALTVDGDLFKTELTLNAE